MCIQLKHCFSNNLIFFMSSHVHLAGKTLISTPSGILNLIQQGVLFFFFSQIKHFFLIHCLILHYRINTASSLPSGFPDIHAETHVTMKVLEENKTYVWSWALVATDSGFWDDLREWAAEISGMTRSFEEGISRYWKTRIL